MGLNSKLGNNLKNPQPYSAHLTSVDKSLAAFLALLLFGLYMVTFDGTLHSTDGLSMIAVTENLVKHGRFDTRQLENWESATLGIDGKPYPVFPIGPTLFMLPFFVLALVLPNLGLTQTSMILMPLCSALNAAYLYLSVRRLEYSMKIGLTTSLMAGLATMTWLRTRDLVADPLILLGLTATFYYALAYKQDQKLNQAAMMGVALGFTILNKLINATTVPFFLWYLTVPGFDIFRFKKFHWRAGFIAVLPIIIAILATGSYNDLRFGSFFDSGFRGSLAFSTPVWIGFTGLIISPYKSLLLYIPLFLLIPFVIRETWQKHPREVVLILALLVSQMLFFGTWHDWGGGRNWGPRYLAPMNGLLTLLLLPFIDRGFQPNHWRQRTILIIFSLISFLMQILGISARDNAFLNAADYWTPPPNLSFWGELRWVQPDQWPIWGHWMQFNLGNIPFIWRWQWANLTHFDPVALLAALLIVGMGLSGVVIVYLSQREAKLKLVIAWLVAIGCVALILVRSYDDPRSIKTETEAAKLWPAYQALVIRLPELVSPADALIFTDRRFEFYLLDTDKSLAQRYVVAKPSQPEILEIVPKLLQQQVEQGRIWLVTDDLDNRQLAHATELWLKAHGPVAASYIFGESVRLTAFEPLPSPTTWEAIPEEPQLAGLVEPDDYKFKGIAALLGWDWSDLEQITPPTLQAGRAYNFELYWIYHGKALEDLFFIRLLDSIDQPVTEVLMPPRSDGDLSRGQLLIEAATVSIPPHLAPGVYHLQIGFLTSAVETGELTFDLPAEMTEIRIVN